LCYWLLLLGLCANLHGVHNLVLFYLELNKHHELFFNHKFYIYNHLNLEYRELVLNDKFCNRIFNTSVS
jgi:hypothetical protein